MDNREIYITRIKQDLIGPNGELDEVIDESPSERYYCGIIYPKKTELSQEDDLGNDQVNSGGGDSQDDVLDETPPLYNSYKPSTAGISFNLENKVEKKLSIDIEFKCGIYKRQEIINEETNKSEISWKRKQINFNEQIDFSENIISFEKHELGHCGLYIRRIDAEGYSTITLQIVNNFTNENITDQSEKFINREEHTLFQVEMKVTCRGSTKFKSRKSQIYTDDEDSKSSELIYRNSKEYSTGHNCSSSWHEEDGEVKNVSLEWFPTSEVKGVNPDGDEELIKAIKTSELKELSAWKIYNASKDDLINSLMEFTTGYLNWIKKQEKMSVEINLDETEKKQAKINLDNCTFAFKRMREGIDYLAKNQDALKAFKLANYAMQIQRSWQKGNMSYENHDPEHELIWRPFQLAFVLMTLASSSERSHEERKIFDLIWFPTGGGKTEAYLLLSAYVIFFRRLRFENRGAGLSVVMRYTLRTLTIQQFQRAAALITACELLRRKKFNKLLGETGFSIGLWVGRDSTPNNIEDARKALSDTHATSTPKQIKRCPCCDKKETLNWDLDTNTSQVLLKCQNSECPIDNIPLMTVDEQLYNSPPSLLIGTVDKFAMMVKVNKISNFFGKKNKVLPPDLIIQDELHLISGPLGSITGLYEIALDYLCSTDEGPCKIIGSTATIRQASKQINALYFRKSFQFPPSGIDESNSGFSKKDKSSPGRIYIGVNSAGNSPKYILQALSASLLQASKDKGLNQSSKEFYSTLVAYFNSIKELGGALTLMQDDVPITIQARSKQRDEKDIRKINFVEELTSRKDSSQIPEILDSLALKSEDDGFVDILLASNMISVGVDIPRLGLMVVNGQPKTISEYIQATSRVGRTSDGPGLIFTLFNHNKVRDRAFYETFCSWHSSLYRSVEPTSVTPFAPRARDKALHAPVIALMRLSKEMKSPKLNDYYKNILHNDLLPFIKKRIQAIDNIESNDAINEIKKFIDMWEYRNEIKYFWNDRNFKSSLLTAAEKEVSRVASGRGRSNAKPTPMSVRNVEASVPYKIVERLKERPNDAE